MKLNLSDFWSLFSIPEPVVEYKFLTDRRFRFDFAWLKYRIAVEINGGVFIGGRHTRGYGYQRDMEKLNLAQAAGWKVFQFTPQQFKNGEAGEFLEEIFRKEIDENHRPHPSQIG